MNVAFSNIDLLDQPNLILETMSFNPIAPLTAYVYEVSLKPMYNETSELSFTVPAFIDYSPVPFYSDIQSMRVVELCGVGRFILANPHIVGNGIFEKKTCVAYSLEYETTFKNLSLASGTYNLWNPIKPENTIIGMFMQDLPAWKRDAATVEVDAELIDRYRTFEYSGNWYNFLKGTAQKSYQCIFEFDSMERIIRVRAVKNGASTKQVFVSLENLLKEIDIQENTDDICTCLEPYGANELDIRSVNPLGTNKIYNLDYYMTPMNFSSETITHWNLWKENLNATKDVYYSKTIERALLHTQAELARAKLANIKNDITRLENLYSVAVQAENEGIELGSDKSSSKYKADLDGKKSEYAAQEVDVSDLTSAIENIQKQLAQLNKDSALTNYFEQDEINAISLYIKERTLTESSFVAQEIVGYNDTGHAYDMTGGTVSVSNAKISKVDTESTTETYMIDGGLLSISGLDIDGMINFGTLDVRANQEKIVMSIVIKAEKADEDGNTDWITANVSIVGTPSSVNHSDTGLNVQIQTATVYYTTGVTEYQRQSVEWELYDYASDLLDKVSYPSYKFDVDCSNFLAADGFEQFKNRLELGQKIYLKVNDELVLQPIVIGAEMKYGKPESFSLNFADQFNANVGEYQLKDILEQSVSMGGVVDAGKLSWNAWQDSGASTIVSDYMNSALDAAVQSIISSSGQEIEINGSGIHLRKSEVDASGNPTGEFDPCEIWMNNNSIMFTDDSWNSAKMAIGKGANGFGIIADYLIGTFVASEKLTVTNAGGDFTINENGITVKDLNFKITHSDDSGGLVTESFESYMSDIQDAIKNGVISTFSQPDRPDLKSGIEGDIWFDTDDNNKMYRLTKVDISGKSDVEEKYGYTSEDFRQLTDDDGTLLSYWLCWIPVDDPRLSTIIGKDSSGKAIVNASTVSGAANLVAQNMKFSATNTEFNAEGMWMVSFENGVPNGVVWLNGSGVAISQTKNTSASSGTSPYSSAYWNFSSGSGTTVLDPTGVAANKFIGDSIFGNIELGIGPQKTDGVDSTRPFYVDKNGKLHAAGADISGVVDATGFKINGKNALTNDSSKIDSDYLELKGLSITDEDGDVTFSIDGTTGQVNLINSTLNGGLIKGAQLEIYDENAGLYIYNSSRNLRGVLYYDSGGAGTDSEAAERVLLSAVNSALKLNAAYDISIGNPNWASNNYHTYIYNPVFSGSVSGLTATAVFG